MSFVGALILCIVALVGYALMGKFIGGGFSVKDEPSVQFEMERPVLPVVLASEYQTPSARTIG
jgi:hypothetical protein